MAEMAAIISNLKFPISVRTFPFFCQRSFRLNLRSWSVWWLSRMDDFDCDHRFIYFVFIEEYLSHLANNLTFLLNFWICLLIIVACIGSADLAYFHYISVSLTSASQTKWFPFYEFRKTYLGCQGDFVDK